MHWSNPLKNTLFKYHITITESDIVCKNVIYVTSEEHKVPHRTGMFFGTNSHHWT